MFYKHGSIVASGIGVLLGSARGCCSTRSSGRSRKFL